MTWEANLKNIKVKLVFGIIFVSYILNYVEWALYFSKHVVLKVKICFCDYIIIFL